MNSDSGITEFLIPQMGMQVNPLMLGQPAQEEDMEEDENMGVAETYADYMPSKCKWLLQDSSDPWCMIF